ncbi:MAG: type II toxin-antitoxin system RelE/ParE family toxin [Pseudomonadota bacterium]
MAIKSITHRGLRRLYEENSTRGVDARYAGKIRQMLTILDIARDVTEVNVRLGWKLHALTGDLAGFWSLTVNGARRLSALKTVTLTNLI